MKLKDNTITKGFIVAGLMNMTVLLNSKFFTNSVIPKYDPVVMSNFGLLMIVVWGLAYISVAKSYKSVKWLVAVFAIEKLIYGCVWMNWITKNSVSAVFEENALAGVFYASYGINDLFFFVFFLFTFIYTPKK